MSGKHGFSGSCAPGNTSGWSDHFNTFSYGIFEMVPAKTVTCWKKGAVKVRVSGQIKNAEAVKARTEQIVAELDNGTYVGPKNVKV